MVDHSWPTRLRVGPSTCRSRRGRCRQRHRPAAAPDTSSAVAPLAIPRQSVAPNDRQWKRLAAPATPSSSLLKSSMCRKWWPFAGGATLDAL